MKDQERGEIKKKLKTETKEEIDEIIPWGGLYSELKKYQQQPKEKQIP